MASAGIAGEEVEAAGNATKNTRRISDYLDDSDDGEAEAEVSQPSPPETPPQLRLPRFTCARFRFGRIGRKRDDSRKEAGVKKTEDASVPDSSAAGSSSKPAETSTSSSSSASAGAGSGVGLSMLLLLARTCVELNRMAEVRAQMETLLKEIRDEADTMKKASAAHHHVDVTPTRAFTLQMPSSTTTVSSSSCTSDTDTNHHHHHAATDKEIARHRECESRPGPAGGGDDELVELEAAAEELEAEPALNCTTVECSTEEENSDESSDDEFIELDGRGRFDRKWATGDEDSEEEPSTAGAQDGGVCAAELERRLHELLHQRDRERIEELESALRRAEQKLREKEMEARLWQDTATLALQPPPRDGQ